MTDIVERLRTPILVTTYTSDGGFTTDVLSAPTIRELEAADEIERLRAALAQIARFEETTP